MTVNLVNTQVRLGSQEGVLGEQPTHKNENDCPNESNQQIHNKTVVVGVVAQALGYKTADEAADDPQNDIDQCRIVAAHETASQITGNTADDN
ncbi:hypothetical protein FAES_0999 [Fibrella aestuarina BUZ 2]|uniref:Uncharacterized protein n=1 Tax=Fibrella aestuarina BUZ 2 TaxID=1166018 RepID=I0K4F7_9BACT|nr:hypothetical protein FAES_0999 [Fibrella aestuarina BUZ 2]